MRVVDWLMYLLFVGQAGIIHDLRFILIFNSRRLLDGRHDMRVGAATTKIAGTRMLDFCRSGPGIIGQQRGRAQGQTPGCSSRIATRLFQRTPFGPGITRRPVRDPRPW